MMQSFFVLFWMTVLTGFIYPLLITGIAQLVMPYHANGSLIRNHNQVVGSSLIAQRFSSDKYFWPRPSAVDYRTMPSGGSNFSQTSVKLKEEIEKRRQALATAYHMDAGGYIPEDLVFTSASGLDPHISQMAAYFQLDRVAKARGWDAANREIVQRIIDSLVEHNPRVFPGEPGVNVLLLNEAIDRYAKLSNNNE